MATSSNYIYYDTNNNINSLLQSILRKDEELKCNTKYKSKFIWTKRHNLYPFSNKFCGFYGIYNLSVIETIKQYMLPSEVNLLSFPLGFKSNNVNTKLAFIWIENQNNTPLNFTIGWIPKEFINVFNDCILISDTLYNFIQQKSCIRKKFKLNKYI
jgi:hypothetical protein